jgi:hypothetical protein
MRKTKTGIMLAVGFVLASLTALPAQVATPVMVGRWKGEAQIAVDWTKARTLLVDIRIASDDRVTGTIGDASLVDGRLMRNRGPIARALGLSRDYIIAGALEGPVIAVENIERDAVKMPLNWIDGRFEGGFNTSGTKLGGAESMVLAAEKLVLHRVPDMIICPAESKQRASGC